MAATKLTVADVFSRAHLSPQLASFEKKSEYKGKDNALAFLKLQLQPLRALLAASGLKSGHQARLRRAWRTARIEAGVQPPPERVRENEVAWIESFVPFASFLASVDTKKTESVVEILRMSTDAVLPLQKTFDAFDKNKDGEIDEKEFVEGFAELLIGSKTWLVPYLEFMAANPLQDMERELDDLKSVTAYLKSNFTRDFYPQVAADAKDKKRLQQIFKTADTNQDGVIDKREFMNNVLICLFQSVDRVVLKGACKNAVAAEDAKTMKRLPSLETQGTSMPLRMPDVCEEEESKIGGQSSVIGVALVRPPRPVGIPARPSGPRRGGATA